MDCFLEIEFSKIDFQPKSPKSSLIYWTFYRKLALRWIRKEVEYSKLDYGWNFSWKSILMYSISKKQPNELMSFEHMPSAQNFPNNILVGKFCRDFNILLVVSTQRKGEGNGEREWEAAGTGTRESQESMQKVPSKLHFFI